VLIRIATSDKHRLPGLYRQLGNACLDLSVAVCAQQDALRRLLAELGNRARDSSNAEAKRLGAGIDVMELERSRMASIAT
jgi:hypothetical protein